MTHHSPHSTSLNQVALHATLHCLSGCAVGEILGMVLGRALGWGSGSTIALSILLAFGFGYAFALVPLVRGGLDLPSAVRVAFLADTFSIAVMEVVDNGVMLLLPGAMEAHVTGMHFWLSMVAALALAGVAAFPVNRWLIARGRGHAAAHSSRGPHQGHSGSGDHREAKLPPSRGIGDAPTAVREGEAHRHGA